jgi:serine phosphatase RsbU (regulator of sigma subunit)
VALRNAQLFGHIQEANEQLKKLNFRLQDELTLARQIQQSLLPPPKPDWLDLDILCYSQPAREVGGDLYAYQAFDLSQEAQPMLRYGVAVGDVSGKGMPAALLMAVSLASFRSIIDSDLTPAELLVRMDQAITNYTQSSHQNCALVYAQLSRSLPHSITNTWEGEPVYTLQATNAGCITPLIRRASGRVEWIDIGGLPLGMGLDLDLGYQEANIHLDRGDVIILASDGVIEARNAARQILGFEQFEQIVMHGPIHSAEAMLEHLKREIFIFTGETELYDDMTLVVMRV